MQIQMPPPPSRPLGPQKKLKIIVMDITHRKGAGSHKMGIGHIRLHWTHQTTVLWGQRGRFDRGDLFTNDIAEDNIIKF